MWRSEDEMLEVVQRRAAASRDRRRALLTGSTAAVLLVAALAVAAVRSPSDDGQQLRVAAPAGGRVTTTLAQPPASLDSPPIAIVPAPASSAAGAGAAAAAAATTTTAPATAPPRPTTTARAATTTTTTTRTPPTTAALPAICAPGDVSAAVVASQPSFATGEPVRLTGTLRNTSGRACGYSTDGMMFKVQDSAGASVGADRGVSSHVDCAEGVTTCGVEWAPGDDETSSWCWDQLRHSGDIATQAPPGRYTVTLTWTGRISSPVTASVSVDVLPPPAGTTPPNATC